MAKKSKVYTRSGDAGTTGLVGGSRVSKSDHRIDLYGDVDELNSHVGLLCTHLSQTNKYDDVLTFMEKVQIALFDIGSNLACETEKREQFKLPQIKEELVAEMEEHIDRYDAEVEPMKYFVLPGGHLIASQLHVCRTVCRRVERKMISFFYEHKSEIPVNSDKFLNRLSDYFFVLSRYVNKKEKTPETFWIPEK